MTIEVRKANSNGKYNCLVCSKKVEKIVIITEEVYPKINEGISIEFRTYLCEECFRKIFSANNWCRHWRVELKKPIKKQLRAK